MKKFKNRIGIALSIFFLLSACTVTTTQEGKNLNTLPLVADKNRYLDVDGTNLTKEKKLEIYANQLQKTYKEDDYALITALPYSSYFTINVPFMVYEIDGQQVRTISNQMFRSNQVQMIEYGQYNLKVPSGEHRLVIRNGSAKSLYYTELNPVVFEKGKKYVIGSEYVKVQKSKIYIAEYEIDHRFKATESEHFIIKKKIIENVPMGNLKHVRVY